MATAPLKIKKLIFDSPMMMAPMAGVTDTPFRHMMRRFGNELFFTEMVLADSLVYDRKKNHRIALCSEEDNPIAVQLLGHNPETMAEAARIIESNGGVSFIDINMGCSVPKVVKNGNGSGMMKTPELAGKVVAAMVDAVSVPITVKFRLGWDENSINYLDFGKRMQEAGASAVTLHARTRDKHYSGEADWDAIKQLKESLSIPVIGNGDVRLPEDAQRMLSETGVDGVMVGRGALGKPYFLAQCTALLKGEKELKLPLLSELALEHFSQMENYYGGQAIFIARKHIAWYSLGLKNSTQFREKINKMTDADEIKNSIRQFFDEEN